MPRAVLKACPLGPAALNNSSRNLIPARLTKTAEHKLSVNLDRDISLLSGRAPFQLGGKTLGRGSVLGDMARTHTTTALSWTAAEAGLENGRPRFRDVD